MGQAAAEKIAAEVAPYRDATAENPYREESPDDRPRSELGKHHRKRAIREGRCIVAWAGQPQAAPAPHEEPATVAGEEQGAPRKVKRKAKRAKKTADADADPED